MVDERGAPAPEVAIDQPVFVDVEYWNLSEDATFRPSVNLHFFNGEGVCLFVTWDENNAAWKARARGRELVRTRVRVPGNFLAEGSVFILAGISSLNPTLVHVRVEDAVAFHVLDTSEGEGVRSGYGGDWPGVVRPLLEWEASGESL